MQEEIKNGGNEVKITKISGMFEKWYLDYASYVILERAVPALEDGFKPVQRRIMHSMQELEDGRYNKVANVVGNTMKYHPHGDASITEAMVQMGQKDLLIDTQGNWGNILTGDSAAAARYIEARLSKFALDVVFSPKITPWHKSYDGRNDEPTYLPVKFPLLLSQGAEGIAVGLSTKILPHNFVEIIDASISYLRGKPFELYPDFPTSGMIDVSQYADGERGGRVRIRAKISTEDKSVLKITEIPFSTTTSSVIESIVKANEKGKIKIKKIEDNTSENAEILVYLPSGISPDKTIDALYAFSDCEVSISPICCVIEENKPIFTSVSELLKKSTDRTVSLIKKELEIQLEELEEKLHFASLEKLFINHEMYIDFKYYEDKKSLFNYMYQRFEPFREKLIRDIEDQDLEKLTQIPMMRITKFDNKKADEKMVEIEKECKRVKNNLENLINYTIDYFKGLKNKYGKTRERKTQIKQFDEIEATKVAIKNLKLYVDKEEGFVGTAMKKDELVCDCSDIDDIIVFTKKGKMIITKVSEKAYIDKGILHVDVFKKNDKRTVYNLIYKNAKDKITYIKRFNVTGIIRDKEYEIVEEAGKSEILYFSANPNGEAEKVEVRLKDSSLKNAKMEIDFANVLIKGRASRGNIVSKKAVAKVVFKQSGISTLKPMTIWYDKLEGKLNADGNGQPLGEFSGEDYILTISKEGVCKTSKPDMNMHIDENTLIVEKFDREKPISVIYYDREKDKSYAKRFLLEGQEKEEVFFEDSSKMQLLWVSTSLNPKAEVIFTKVGRERAKNMIVDVKELTKIQGIKTVGKVVSENKIKEVIDFEDEGEQKSEKNKQTTPKKDKTEQTLLDL